MTQKFPRFPPESLAEARELANALIFGGSSSRNQVNIPDNTTFQISNLNIGNITSDSTEETVKVLQRALWDNTGIYTSMSKRIAIDRYLYFKITISQTRTSSSEDFAINKTFFSGDAFLGLTNREVSADGNTLTADFLFRLTQPHINRLTKLYFVPNIIEEQTADLLTPFNNKNTDITVTPSDLTLTSEANFFSGPSVAFFQPSSADALTFTLNTATTNAAAMCTKTIARTNAFPVPIFSGYMFSGLVDATNSLYSNFFVKKSIGAAFFRGTAVTPEPDLTQHTTLNANAVDSTLNYATTPLLINMDWLKWHPKYGNNNSNEGLNLNIRLNTTGSISLYAADLGFGSSTNDTDYLNMRFTANTARFYVRNFVQIKVNDFTSVNITRALLFFVATANINQNISITLQFTS